MPLIKIAAPVPTIDGNRAEGMDITTVDINPGRPPPWIIPHCRSCMRPVERFTVDWIASSDYLPIEVECHGKTRAYRATREDVLRASRGAGVFWVFAETANGHRNGP